MTICENCWQEQCSCPKYIYGLNTTHWLRCASNLDYIPKFPGDTSIRVVGEPISKKKISASDIYNIISKINL